MKDKRSIYFLLIISVLLSSCHRDLSDPFIPKDKKFDTQFKFSPRKNRTVEKHSSFARSKGGFKDSFGSSKRGGSKGGGGKDSFSFKPKKRTGGGLGKDSFSSRVKKKHGGGFSKDSFSASKRGRFGKSGGAKYSARQGGGNDSYSSKHKRVSGMFRFSKTKNSIVSKQKFSAFGAKKHFSESGSFSKKHSKGSGQFGSSSNKRQGNKRHIVFSGVKRLRASESFNVRVKKHAGAFGFNAKKKRASPVFKLIKQKDTDPGSFGHGRSKPNFSKQYVFSQKQKKVKKRDSIWWDMNQSFHKKKRKKQKRELELFDPKMSRKMKLAK